MTQPKTITVRVGKPVPAFPDPDDPRPAFAAELVPGSDTAPGATWPAIRAYVEANQVHPGYDGENVPHALNTWRAAVALRRLGVANPNRLDSPAEVVTDMLADLRHAADALGLDFTDLDESADRRYREEAVRGEL